MKIILVVILVVILILLIPFIGFLFLLKYRKKGSYFDSNGCKIHYRVEGNGPPIILIHGYGVNADINWRWNGIIRKLRKDFTVISLDVRGHGLSDKPQNPECYGIEMVNDIVRLMDHLKIPKAYIMGYSMGGFITLKFITMYPDRVIKAIVGGAGYEKPDGENLKILMDLVESLESGKGYYPLTKALEPNRKEPPRWKIKLIDFCINRLSDTKSMANVMKKFLDLQISEESLKNNKVPILVIVGSKDPLKGGVEALEKILSNGKVIYLKNKDHGTALLTPKFIKAVLEFLRA